MVSPSSRPAAELRAVVRLRNPQSTALLLIRIRCYDFDLVIRPMPSLDRAAMQYMRQKHEEASVLDTLHSFLIRDPDATGHDVWDYAWALHLEQISGHSFDKYRTAICIAFRGLWLGDSTDAVVRKYIDGLTLRAARQWINEHRESSHEPDFPSEWQRKNAEWDNLLRVLTRDHSHFQYCLSPDMKAAQCRSSALGRARAWHVIRARN